MLDKGREKEEVFSFLLRKKREDIDHSRILSSMCTVPHPVAVQAHMMFMEANLGDPGLFPGTASLENLLVQRLGSLFHNDGAGGYATSGGTESNIQALRLARVLKGGVGHPNVVLPESAHFSFRKAAELLSLEVRSVPLDDHFRMDAGKAAECVDRDTVCLVAVAGTTEYGMVDPVAELSRLACDNDLFFHVDAAFGGMVIPFLERPVPFDFALDGVTSIAVDPHKMGMSTIPAGCLLTREPDMLQALNIDTPYLSVKQEYTLAGTRPGAPVVGALAVLDYLGKEGMTAVVRGCMKNTERLIAGLEAFGIMRAVTPDVNVATFAGRRAPDPWKVSWTRQGYMRIVCMPHVSKSNIEAFVKDIGEMYA